MVSIYDVLKASKGIHVEDSFAEIWGRKLRGGYEIKTLTGVPPFTFTADGEPLIDWSMSGQTVQASTPTPSSPVAAEGVGILSGSDYIIPITCGGQTTNVYLGSATSTRRIKKLVLTGDETDWIKATATYAGCFYKSTALSAVQMEMYCTHLPYIAVSNFVQGTITISASKRLNLWFPQFTSSSTVTEFKQYLAQQYENGTPVTVWYVLATPETAAVNEPLMKIGSYADEITKTSTGVDIPTTNGSNTLTVDTTVQPSSMSITFMGK